MARKKPKIEESSRVIAYNAEWLASYEAWSLCVVVATPFGIVIAGPYVSGTLYQTVRGGRLISRRVRGDVRRTELGLVRQAGKFAREVERAEDGR